MLLIINRIIFHLRNTAYGLGNGNNGKEEDGACLLLPEESGRRARRSAIRKNEKGISPILAGERENVLCISTVPKFFLFRIAKLYGYPH